MQEHEFTEQYKEHHEKNHDYGVGGKSDLVYELEILLKPKSRILDYGCGKGKLVEYLKEEGFIADGYDPAIPKYSKMQTGEYDAVCCNDVLEHVPEEGLDKVFRQILSYKPRFISLNIGIYAAEAILPNGKNAHETIRPMIWWRDKINSACGHLYSLRQTRQVDHITSKWLLERRESP